ncbi:uncharacterized protein [Nicotiana tomentosiformis]|uniref:uncharacterized protein n=1 Tax=Nicotiana tomentosiformis TaxID=4098 RepID=UPI00388C8651
MAQWYQTSAVLPVGLVQPIIAIQLRERAMMSIERLKRLDKFTKLFPICFGGTPFEDSHDFLDYCHEVFLNMGIVESNRIDLVVFQMHNSAKRWWQEYVQGRRVGSSLLTWVQFSQLFLEKFIPFTQREDFCSQFEGLQQGSMTVTLYEKRFVDLSCDGDILIPTERERVKRFIDGLTYGCGDHQEDRAHQRLEAVASDAMITSIISVRHRDASLLFDPGSTYSFVSSYFAHYLDMHHDSLDIHVHISTMMGDSIVVDCVYRSYAVTIGGYETIFDLLLLCMVDFDVILGMYWLSPYHTILDYHAKTVTLDMPGLPSDISADTPTVELVSVVREFPNLFPAD